MDGVLAVLVVHVVDQLVVLLLNRPEYHLEFVVQYFQDEFEQIILDPRLPIDLLLSFWYHVLDHLDHFF